MELCGRRRTGDGGGCGEAIVTVDAVDTGVGNRVLVATDGLCAMSAVGRWPSSPIDSAVIGVVDEIELIPGVTR